MTSAFIDVPRSVITASQQRVAGWPPGSRSNPAGRGSYCARGGVGGRLPSCDVNENAAVSARRIFGVVGEHLNGLKPRDRQHRPELVSEIEPLEQSVFLLFEDRAIPPLDGANLPGGPPGPGGQGG